MVTGVVFSLQHATTNHNYQYIIKVLGMNPVHIKAWTLDM